MLNPVVDLIFNTNQIINLIIIFSIARAPSLTL